MAAIHQLTPTEALQAMLERKGLSPRELAEASGLTLRMVNRLVTGKREISEDQYEALERALGMPTGLLDRLERRRLFKLARGWGKFMSEERRATRHLLPREWLTDRVARRTHRRQA